MGARVAMVLAARHPDAIRSVALLDIGPEAWTANWQESLEAFEAMPPVFNDEADAIAFASRGREMSGERKRLLLARLRRTGDGRLTWRAAPDVLGQIVRSHRSRNYWSDWERIQPPALLVRGGASRELRSRIYEQMQRRNPRPQFVELDGVGHNIPLIAPDRLAPLLTDLWTAAESQ